MRVVLSPGDTLSVGLEGTDGNFTVKCGESDLTLMSDFTITAASPGSLTAVIHCEKRDKTGALGANHVKVFRKT